MLEVRPGSAVISHYAFALTTADADAAAELARRTRREGPRAVSQHVGRWLESGTPGSNDRRTPLDPRVDAAMARLGALVLHPEGDATIERAEVLSAWSATPREVWREAERTLFYRVFRAERLVALDAPDLILRVELEGVGRALAALDAGPRPIGSFPDTDPGPFVELRHAIERHALLDLSLGTHGETFRALSLEGEPEAALAALEPLVPRDALEAAAPLEDEVERAIAERLDRWRCGPASVLATCALELADRLVKVTADERAAVRERLDASEAEPLRGGDYVAAAEARLREIAELATRATKDGLVVLATLAHDDE